MLGIKLTHSTPGRPQGRGKIERLFLTVREQFLVEITGDPGQAGRRQVTSIGELNRLFTAWAETVYHRRVHSETGQAPLQRWADGWAGAAPPLPDPAQLHEAFLWSERRTVRKTATVSLHGNTYQVDPSLAGRKVELIFDPFDLTSIEVRWQGRPAGQAIPHLIGRHAHPKARPEQPAPPAARDRHRLHRADRRRPRHPPRRRRHQLRRPQRPARPDPLPGQLTTGQALAQEDTVSIEKLQAHYGFTRMPFRRDLAPGMLHRHAAHAEAAARIGWCISEHALGVITGEVGAGKTVALRAALASLDPSRHTLIYLGNPSVGVRGINHAIVAALGGVPKTHHATLTPQAMDLLAREHAERGRIPVLAIDEAHMLEPAQLEADPHAHQPRPRRRLPAGLPAHRPAHPAAADQARHPRRPRPAHRRPLHHARHDQRGDHQLHHPPPPSSPDDPTRCSATTPPP